MKVNEVILINELNSINLIKSLSFYIISISLLSFIVINRLFKEFYEIISTNMNLFVKVTNNLQLGLK